MGGCLSQFNVKCGSGTRHSDVAKLAGRGRGFMTKDLSVVICTKDRAPVLAATLQALLRQLTDRDEVIIVDNGSTDDTSRVVRNVQPRHAEVKYLYEARPGKSSARNRGIERAKGRYIAFLDDDAMPLAGWRKCAVRAFEDLPDRCGALTGQIIPKVENGKPAWMSDRDFNSLSSRVMRGDQPLRLTGRPWLVTANVLCKRDVLEEVGGFNRLFDQCGYGEDIELAVQISKRGYHLYYYPALKVHHVLPASRFTVESLVQRRFYGAFGECLVYYSTEPDGKRRLFVGKQFVKRPVFLLAGYLGLICGRVLGRKRDVVFLQTRIARSLGYLQAAVSLIKPGGRDPRRVLSDIRKG